MSVVFLDDAIAYGKAKAGPIRFGRKERLEDLGDIIVWDSTTCVPDLDYFAVSVRAEIALYDDTAIFLNSFDGIDQKVYQDLLHQIPIQKDIR